MMTNPLRFLSLALLTLLLLAPRPATAETAVGVEAGTLGLGVRATHALTRSLNLRGVVATWDESLDYDAAGIHYEGDLELLNAALLLDWHPGGAWFRLSGGAVFNDNRLLGRAPLEALIEDELGDLLPPQGIPIPSPLGTLEGKATVDSLVPYLGIGFGNPIRPGRRWSVAFDLGALLQGEPDVALRAETTLPIDAVPGARELLDELLAQEEAELRREADDYTIYPVVSVSVSYRLF